MITKKKRELIYFLVSILVLVVIYLLISWKPARVISNSMPDIFEKNSRTELVISSVLLGGLLIYIFFILPTKIGKVQKSLYLSNLGYGLITSALFFFLNQLLYKVKENFGFVFLLITYAAISIVFFFIFNHIARMVHKKAHDVKTKIAGSMAAALLFTIIIEILSRI